LLIPAAFAANPEPLNEIVCGEPAALSVIVTDALRLPAAGGVNLTEMLQLPPANTTAPQVVVRVKSAALVPVSAMLAMERLPLPVLLNVTIFGTLAIPTF
jgi:hypothetical protein